MNHLSVKDYFLSGLRRFVSFDSCSVGMIFKNLPLMLFPAILFITNSGVFGQSGVYKLKLNRRNPDGWFSLQVPRIMGRAEPFADVSGGSYNAGFLDISYDYWTYESTPNWLRDTVNRYSKSAQLICPVKNRNTYTLRTRVDGRRAIIQRCLKNDDYFGVRYVYYITFPKVKILESGSSGDGMFSLTIKYKNKSYLPVAARVIRSIRFQKTRAAI